MAQFIASYGVWLVTAFIALESVGIPVPAEAALMTAGFIAARSHSLSIYVLVTAAVFGAKRARLRAFGSVGDLALRS